MDFKTKKILLVALISIITSGCSVKSSDGRSFPDLSPAEIYQNKLAHCENSVSYAQVTEYVAKDRTLSPEDRRAEKEKEWERWQQEVLNTKNELSGKKYIIKIPAAFHYYDEKNKRMKLTGGTQKNQYNDTTFSFSSEMDLALPSQILFNSTKVGDLFYSSPLPTGIPYYNGAISNWVINHFGNSATAADNIYVINSVQRSSSKSNVVGVIGKYGGFKLNGDWQLGVSIDASNWMNHPQSPIYKENDNLYLDLRRFNFLDSFGVYPDTGTVYIQLEYIFEINGCIERIPQGNIKELIVNAWNEISKTYKPIAKLVF